SIRFLKQLPFQWAFFFIVMFMVISIAGMIVVMDNLEAIVVDGLNKDLTLTGRTPLWEFLFQNKISQRPVLGYGIAGFWQRWRAGDNPAANTLDGRLEMPSGDGHWNPPHSHNGFIEIIIAVGFVGFFFFAISFLTAVANAIRYLAIPQPPGTGMIESALPLIFLFFVLLPNITEIPLIENNHSWYYYIATAVGLCVKNSPKNLRIEPTETKPILPQKIPL
ncbi:MAG: O-antigen ligase family protein, partial [Planktothrix sp.]